MSDPSSSSECVSGSTPIQVCLYASRPLVLDLLKIAFDRETNFGVTGAHWEADAAISNASQKQPDIVVVYSSVDVVADLDLVRRFRSESHTLFVVASVATYEFRDA